MFDEPHSDHKHIGTAAQHLVLFRHITEHTTVFTGHMRMNEYNYTHSRSHTVFCLNTQQGSTTEEEAPQSGVEWS